MSARKYVTITRIHKHEPEDCVRALALLLNKPVSKAAEPVPEPDSCHDAAIVGNTEVVSHVDQRPD